MLSCWHDLLFLWCLLLFYLLLLSSMGWLCGVGVFGLIECSHSLPALPSGLQIMMNDDASVKTKKPNIIINHTIFLRVKTINKLKYRNNIEY